MLDFSGRSAQISQEGDEQAPSGQELLTTLTSFFRSWRNLVM
jgi:hypothetical protein